MAKNLLINRSISDSLFTDSKPVPSPDVKKLKGDLRMRKIKKRKDVNPKTSSKYGGVER